MHSVFWENLAEQDFRELDIFRRNFYEPLQALGLFSFQTEESLQSAVESSMV